MTPYARSEFIRMLAEREAQGIKTYGTSLHTHNGRDACGTPKRSAWTCGSTCARSSWRASRLHSVSHLWYNYGRSVTLTEGAC